MILVEALKEAELALQKMATSRWSKTEQDIVHWLEAKRLVQELRILLERGSQP